MSERPWPVLCSCDAPLAVNYVAPPVNGAPWPQEDDLLTCHACARSETRGELMERQRLFWVREKARQEEPENTP